MGDIVDVTLRTEPDRRSRDRHAVSVAQLQGKTNQALIDALSNAFWQELGSKVTAYRQIVQFLKRKAKCLFLSLGSKTVVAPTILQAAFDFDIVAQVLLDNANQAGDSLRRAAKVAGDIGLEVPLADQKRQPLVQNQQLVARRNVIIQLSRHISSRPDASRRLSAGHNHTRCRDTG